MRSRMVGIIWILAVTVLFLALPVAPALADPPVAPKTVDHPDNKPPVPRGMPDLIPYWNFDPPKSPLFDINR